MLYHPNTTWYLVQPGAYMVYFIPPSPPLFRLGLCRGRVPLFSYAPTSQDSPYRRDSIASARGCLVSGSAPHFQLLPERYNLPPQHTTDRTVVGSPPPPTAPAGLRVENLPTYLPAGAAAAYTDTAWTTRFGIWDNRDERRLLNGRHTADCLDAHLAFPTTTRCLPRNAALHTGDHRPTLCVFRH